MHVISRPAIHRAINRHRDAASWLEKWWQNAGKERWESLYDVRAIYPAADQVDCCLVFNACGNNYRLIVRVSYANPWSGGTLLVKRFVTHAEYNKNDWRKDCR